MALRDAYVEEAPLRCITLALALMVIALLVPAPADAQQSGPVAAVGGDSATNEDSIFPLWKSLLDGKKFLPPYGINVVMLDLSGQWDVKSFSASVGGNELASVSGNANVHPFTYGGRADVWVLPFLNVFATFGGVKLNVRATGLDLPLGVSGGRPPEVIRGDVNLDLDFTGYYGGGGFVLMYAYQSWFTSMDYSTVWTHLQSSQSGVEGSELRTDTASVRLGYNAGAVQPYIGGRWVKKIDHFEGTVAGPGGQPLTFAVELQAPAWNYDVGIHSLVAGRFELVVEAGFGQRTHGLVNFGYRF
ncbi:MAG: hypothetical protein JO203_08680 [Gammaproteobacteria bacterium]|nr:hypothetical protein [Gammaproteobacteria bacterium]